MSPSDSMRAERDELLVALKEVKAENERLRGSSRDHAPAIGSALDGALTDGRRFSGHAGDRYRHVARGGSYTLPFGWAAAGLQTSEPIQDGDVVLVYIGDDGMIWARPPHEFFDGRFELLSSAEQVDVEKSRDQVNNNIAKAENR